MSDQAPESSRHVRHMLHRARLPGEICDRLEIATRVTPDRRAETVVQRPRVVRSQQNQFDIEFRKVLLTLPGVDRITITMGRTFTVEWDGIRAPV